MKLLKLIFLLLVLTFIKILGQEYECATELHSGVTLQQAQSGDLSLYKRSDFTPPLRLAIHLVKYSDGSGGLSETELNAKISALNFYFEQAMFQFYIFHTDEILNDNYAIIEDTDDLTEANALREINNLSGCINIYFVPQILDAYGLSSFSPRVNIPGLYQEQGILIRNDAPYSTLPHEMGHYFDLFHTYFRYFTATIITMKKILIGLDLVKIGIRLVIY